MNVEPSQHQGFGLFFGPQRSRNRVPSVTVERGTDNPAQQIIRRIVVPAWFAELTGDGASNDNRRLSV